MLYFVILLLCCIPYYSCEGNHDIIYKFLAGKLWLGTGREIPVPPYFWNPVYIPSVYIHIYYWVIDEGVRSTLWMWSCTSDSWVVATSPSTWRLKLAHIPSFWILVYRMQFICVKMLFTACALFHFFPPHSFGYTQNYSQDRSHSDSAWNPLCNYYNMLCRQEEM